MRDKKVQDSNGTIIYWFQLKAGQFADDKGRRFEITKTRLLLETGAVFGVSKMLALAKAKVQDSTGTSIYTS